MTEINTHLPTKAFKPDNSARSGPTNAEANTLSGLASGLNTKQTIDTIMQVEQRRLQPIESRKASTQVELDAFTLVKTSMETLQESSDLLAERSIWEGKVVESSNPDVVTALGTSGAKPGKHTLVVERLALNHQIASQGFEAADTTVGEGSFKVSVGEKATFTVVLDDSNNTLTGLKDAINRASPEVNATIIKTGATERPYQLVLTSQKTGSEGRIALEIGLKGGETPNFQNFVDDPSAWKGVGAPPAGKKDLVTGTGASTVIVRVIGDYAGDVDRKFNFTAVQTGIVGGETSLQMRWEDDSGRSGVLELDSFNYAPGEPLDFVDGLSLIVSPGEIIVGDKFSFRTQAERPGGLWWLSAEERKPAYTQPTSWQRQATFGTPVIEGEFTGEEAKKYTLTVVGSGQIGAAKDLAIRWEEEGGQSGVVRVGQGYGPGSQLALNKGLTLTVNPGVLTNGQVSTFTAVPARIGSQWWLPEEEQKVPASIENITNFEGTTEVEEKGTLKPGQDVEFPEELGPRISSSRPTLHGQYTSDDARVYTFTAGRDGAIGTTKGLSVNWSDDKGNSGTLAVGEGYAVADPLALDAGLFISFGGGRVFDGDTFSVRTHTSTIQPAQDALIRFGATELGGGLPITNTTNEFDDVIEGVKLNLVAVDKKPVTVTIKGDTEKAEQTILKFADDFNQLILLINELTKFDPENNQVGPLLGDRDLSQIQNDLSTRMIDPVEGLPPTLNMLVALGLKIAEKGVLSVDKDAVKSRIGDDFGGVANIFRNRGESDNSGVTFLNMRDETRSNPQGYKVNVEQVATRGYYTSAPLQTPVVVQEGNQSFFLLANGVQSQQIKLDPGVYTAAEYVGVLQNAITNDETIGNTRVRVALEDGKIKVTSGRFGGRSTVGFSSVATDGTLPPALSGGESVTGNDVSGTIDGEPAEGIGQLLRGADTSEKIKGLRLLVTLTENQLSAEGPEANVVITKGVASRVVLHLKDLLDPRQGNMNRITGNLRSQIKALETQLGNMNERIDAKRTRLQGKFARLEGQMSKLKSQQNFMSSQFSALPKAGPGIPG